MREFDEKLSFLKSTIIWFNIVSKLSFSGLHSPAIEKIGISLRVMVHWMYLQPIYPPLFRAILQYAKSNLFCSFGYDVMDMDLCVKVKYIYSNRSTTSSPPYLLTIPSNTSSSVAFPTL
jgi:hypothetical protein